MCGKTAAVIHGWNAGKFLEKNRFGRIILSRYLTGVSPEILLVIYLPVLP